MVSARNICKSFGALSVLKGIDIDIAPGRITAIVGPSGAGKTTLLQILGTLMTPDAGGVVLYDGTDVTALPDRKLSDFRNANIGFVFQFHQLLPEFTLLENVAMPALIGGAGRKEAFAKASALLARLGLESRAEHRPAELSGGECQRAAVARALVNGPSVIFADEPTGNLDSKSGGEVMELLRGIQKQMGKTLVIITHDNRIAAAADRQLTIMDGVLSEVEAG